MKINSKNPLSKVELPFSLGKFHHSYIFLFFSGLSGKNSPVNNLIAPQLLMATKVQPPHQIIQNNLVNSDLFLVYEAISLRNDTPGFIFPYTTITDLQ